MEQVAAHVQNFYAQGPSSAASHEWLVAFQATNDCWSLAPQLLAAPSLQLQLFAANAVYAKVRTDLQKLSVEARHQLRSVIISQLTRVQMGQTQPVVADR